jgi:hypothetical protein
MPLDEFVTLLMEVAKTTRNPMGDGNMPVVPRCPSRFLVRRGPFELVVENRRRLEKGSRIALAIFAACSLVLVLVRPKGEWLVYVSIWSCAGVGWLVSRFWARTTIAFRDSECSVVCRGLFRSRHLSGPSSTLDIVGIEEVDPRKGEYGKGWPLYGLRISLGGSNALVFPGMPRPDLEWVIGQVREWRDSGGTAQLTPPRRTAGENQDD